MEKKVYNFEIKKVIKESKNHNEYLVYLNGEFLVGADMEKGLVTTTHNGQVKLEEFLKVKASDYPDKYLMENYCPNSGPLVFYKEFEWCGIKKENGELSILINTYDGDIEDSLFKYFKFSTVLADIIQEGNVGLMKAVKRFDPNMGVRLVSFAVHWIKAEIHEYVIKNWGIVKVATTKAQRKLFFNLRKMKKDLNWLTHEDAKAIAADLNVNVTDVYEMEKRLSSHDVSFDMPNDDNDENYTAPVNYLQKYHADPLELLEASDWTGREQDSLATALKTLDERSLDILTSRWLIEKKLTLQELAEKYNVSAERIRQLEQNAMKKLRNASVFVA